MIDYLLSLLIWTPIIGGALTLLLGREQVLLTKIFALIISLITFILSTFLYIGFNKSTHLMQFVERFDWIKTFNIEYYLGVDGISMPLIILTALSTVLVVIAAWEVIKLNVNQYMAAFLIMDGLIIGTFSALDSMLFYLFWEASLVPMLLIIGIWGGTRRIYAAIKFFLYTFFGSVFMLASIIYMYNQGGTFAILDLHNMSLTLFEQALIFWAFFIAFAVKVPMFPVHTWLPDAHVEAPTGGSVILAAIMLKMGGYGFFRFSLPITPDAALEFSNIVIILSLIAIVYIGFIALVQKDMKKLIAYSSISHMGFVTLGIFAIFLALKQSKGGALLGLDGAMIQMISHGFISAAMFLSVGVLYDRVHSREISAYGGVANKMPIFAVLATIFALANVGMPGTSGFVGEFMVILGAIQANFWFGFIAALTLIIGAAYTLWMVKRVFWGDVKNDNVANLKDLNANEFLILATLAILVLFMGIYPEPFLEVMRASIENLLYQASESKL